MVKSHSTNACLAASRHVDNSSKGAMRLLNTATSAFAEQGLPPFPFPYAVLSHTWGTQEVSYDDMLNGQFMFKDGFKKVENFQACARDLGYDWCWMDTCCINRSRSTSEQNEAVMSMYTWFRHAGLCVVYLTDVERREDFTKARWFTRAWTLIELLAPENMAFYTRDWQCIGSKKELAAEITAHTNIAFDVLTYARNPRDATIGEKLSWASERHATNPEEEIYILISLLGVRMIRSPGEGRAMATVRMQAQILEHLEDYTILMWHKPLGLAVARIRDGGIPETEDPEKSMNSPDWHQLTRVSPIDMFTHSELRHHLPPLERQPDSPQLTGRGLRVSLLTKTVRTFLGKEITPFIIAWTYCTQIKSGKLYAVCIRVVTNAVNKQRYLRGTTSGLVCHVLIERLRSFETKDIYFSVDPDD